MKFDGKTIFLIVSGIAFGAIGSFLLLIRHNVSGASPIAVVSIWAKDVPEAAHFYRDVIGLPLEANHGDLPTFNLNGTYLAILKGEPQPAKNPIPERFPLIAFNVDDLDSAVRRLQDRGVGLPWGIEEHKDSNRIAKYVMFHDPAGNLIELVQFNQIDPH